MPAGRAIDAGMRHSLALAATLAALALGAPSARAQETPPSPAALVAEVEVIGHLPGPALWRVSTPQSQLWIIGLAAPLPRGFAWDSRRLQAALQGAHEVVLPPGASAGVGDLLGLLLDTGHVLHLPAGETLRGDMAEALRVRFEAAARTAGQDPAHYDHWRPVVAAVALVGDVDRRQGLARAGPQRAVAELARREHVRIRPLANYKVADFVRVLGQVTPEAGMICLTLAVNTAERSAADTPFRAQAWAKGDVAAVRMLDAATSPDECLNAIPAAGPLLDRVARDWAADLARALARPGKTVAAIDLDSLTRKGGLLDQLRAEGLDVIGPAY
jgi:uncharacterized protein YbaP (TraB family)